MHKSLVFIKYLILVGIFATPFIPLIVSGSLFFPFITGKNFCFRILVEIIAGLWLILALYDKKFRPKSSLILVLMTAFILVMGLSTIFGENVYRSFWSNYERMEGYLTYLHLFAYFLVLISMMKSEKLWKWFFHTSLAVSVIMVIYGFLQIGGNALIHQGGVRLDASLGNASYLAIYMVFHAFLSLFYFVKTKDWYKWFYVVLFVLQTVILYYTATRGAILGFIGGLILATFFTALFSPSKKIKIISISGLGLIVAMVGIFIAFKSANFVKNSPVLARFADISFQEQTTQSRLVIWKMSWDGFKEKPVFGWGPENYNLIFNKYYEPVLYKQEPWFDRAHNVFFDRLTTNGIFGLLTYLGLFGVAIYYLFKKRELFSVYGSSVLVALLAAYFFHNLFVFDNIISSILFFSVVGYIHTQSVKEDEGVEEQKNKISIEDDYKKASLSALIVVLMVFVVYSVNVPGFMASGSLIEAVQAKSMGNASASLDKFKESIAYGSFGSSEAREHLSNFAMAVAGDSSMDQGLKDEIYQITVSEMQKQIELSPGDIRYYVFLGAIYNKFQKYDLAIETLSKAIELSPKKQQLYFELGTSYLNMGDFANAEQAMKKAFELDTDFDEARIIYAVSLIYADKFDEASKVLEERFGTDIVNDQRLMNAYAKKGLNEKVEDVLKKMVAESPDNAKFRVNLAATYMQTGKTEDAIKQLEKAIELEPSFKAQGEYYINEIRAGRNP